MKMNNLTLKTETLHSKYKGKIDNDSARLIFDKDILNNIPIPTYIKY